jgi:hypothetical protein
MCNAVSSFYNIYHNYFSHFTEIDRFSFLQDKSISKIRLLQGSAYVDYLLEDTNINSTETSLCAITDSKLERFEPSKQIRIDLALNGQDFTFYRYVYMNTSVPKSSLVFYDTSNNIYT